MNIRNLGDHLEVSALGLGCMGMSFSFPPFPEKKDMITAFAQRKKATPAQIALAWVLSRKPWLVPIPGTTKLHRLQENLGATDIEFSPEELQELDEASSRIAVRGDRYSEGAAKMINR